GRTDRPGVRGRLGDVARSHQRLRDDMVRAVAGSAQGAPTRRTDAAVEPRRRHRRLFQHSPVPRSILGQTLTLEAGHSTPIMTRISTRPYAFRDSEMLRESGIHPVLA